MRSRQTLLVLAAAVGAFGRDNRHPTYPQLGVGASGDRVVDALGAPRERTAERLFYACGREIRPAEQVVFLMADGRVEEVASRTKWSDARPAVLRRDGGEGRESTQAPTRGSDRAGR